MTCLHPLRATRLLSGEVHVHGKANAADFALSHAQADSLGAFQLPCGQCIACRAARAQSWALRIMHEASLYGLENAFITLTYSDAHLPQGYALDVRDWQLFAKKLRLTGRFRFFACGEYGDDLGRPHFHACLFGRSFRDDRQYWRSNEHGDKLYRSPTLEAAWSKGYAEIGNLEYKSAAYVARYCMKKLTGPEAQRYQGRRPPFCVMSRKPGIGKNWLERYEGDVYPHDEVIHRGKKYRPPRYYDEQIDQVQLQHLKEKRIARARERNKDNTPERLAEKEINLQRQWNRKR